MPLVSLVPERHFWIVCVTAAVGGVSGEVFPHRAAGTPIDFSNLWVLLSVPFGVAAACIFVYVVSNTARDDLYRMGAISFLAAFFWEPVILGAGEQFQKKKDEILAEDIGNNATAIATAVENNDLSPEQRTKLIQDAVERINASSAKVSSPSVVWQSNPSIFDRLARTRDLAADSGQEATTAIIDSLSPEAASAIFGPSVQIGTSGQVIVVPPGQGWTQLSPTSVPNPNFQWNSETIKEALEAMRAAPSVPY